MPRIHVRARAFLGLATATGSAVAAALLMTAPTPAQTAGAAPPAAVAPSSATPSSATPSAPALPKEADTAMNTINPARIRAHLKFLSDDLLEGRGTGQRGGDIAAAYIATQFQLMGLYPGGAGNSYMQRVPLVGVETQPDSTLSFSGGSSA